MTLVFDSFSVLVDSRRLGRSTQKDTRGVRGDSFAEMVSVFRRRLRERVDLARSRSLWPSKERDRLDKMPDLDLR